MHLISLKLSSNVIEQQRSFFYIFIRIYFARKDERVLALIRFLLIGSSKRGFKIKHLVQVKFFLKT